jgi:futalosine hydrolase
MIPKKKVLIMTAVEGERDAVLRGLGSLPSVEVAIAGVGPVEAAIHTTKLLAAGKYELVVSAGIAGGYTGKAAIGSIVVASEMVAADLGAESGEGFQSLDKLGFGSARVEADAEWLSRTVDALNAAGLEVIVGPVLTLSTVTGTAKTAEELQQRITGACAEGMEGFGVASAAKAFGIPALELRTISNPVGPRDRAAWRIGDALAALESASKALQEVWK